MSDIRLKYKETPKAGLGVKLFRAGLVVLLLLLIAYFVASSSWFLKSVVLPRVGAALNSTVTVADIELHPFSDLTLEQLKLTPNGAETLLEAKRVHVGYSLLAILRGNLLVEDVTVDSPILTLVENARGLSNLPVLPGSSAPAKPASAPGAPPQLNLKSLALKNATIRHTRTALNGDRVVTELANVNVSVSNVKNGGDGKLTFSAALALDKSTAFPASAANLQSLLTGDFAFNLLDNLKPSSIKGLASFTVGRATGSFAELGALIARLDCDMTPTSIQKFALQFSKGSTALGEVRLSGPFDAEKTEGKLKLEVLAIDRQVLNLLGAARGIDFGTTTINNATDITLTQAGRMISLSGRLQVAKLQVIQGAQTSPTLDLNCGYDLTLDRIGKSVLLKALNFSGTQNQQVLVTTTLSSPLTIAFGDTINAADASLDYTLKGLNLADWRAFAPGLELAGVVGANGKLFSKDGGKRLSLEFEENIKGFSARLGSGPLAVDEISFRGALNHTAQDDALKGTIALNGIKLPDLAGNPLQLTLNLDTAVSNQVAQLNQCSLKLTPTPRARNELTLTGRVDLTDPKAISGNLKLAADALDVTGYYDLFAGQPAKTNVTLAPPVAPAATRSNTEPPPVKLPFHNFTVEANIYQFYLREVDASDFQTTLLLDGSHVLLDPFQLKLNNAPVQAQADLDLSLPGYRYDLTFKADGIPLGPLVNTFSPTYRDQAQGTLLAQASVKGAGVTGGNLRTNLTGTVDFSFTNANIQVVGPKLKTVLGAASVVLGSFGVPDLTSSPLDYVTARLSAGEGAIQIPAFIIQSPIFRADSTGAIPIADVLMDSPLNQPVGIALRRDAAAKLGIANIPTNEPYAKLPTFVHLVGTLGIPGAKTDKAQLSSLALSGIGAAVLKNAGGKTGQEVGGALNALGALLGNKPAATNQPPVTSGTNAASTNQSPESGLLDLFHRLKK